MIKYVFLILIFFSNLSYAENFDEDNFLNENASEPTITQLTDKIERLEHEYKLLQKKYESLATDVEYRFKQLESNQNKSTSNAKIEPSKNTDPKLAKTKFTDAYSLLREQKYNEAEAAFSEFIKLYPNNSYTGNAYYWLGESFMLRKRYDKAALNYLQSFSKFPKNDKADLSMIKLSSALNLLGKKKEACAVISKLKVKKDQLNPTLQKLLNKETKIANCK